MQIIDLGKLRFHFSGEWDASTAYELNDVVRYGNNLYCYSFSVKTVGHDPLETNYWSLMIKGFCFTGIFDHETRYQVGEGASYENKVYVCIKKCIGVIPTDVEFWSQFDDSIRWVGEYDKSVLYQKNDIVRYGASSYIAINPSQNQIPSNSNAWEIFSAGIRFRGNWTPHTSYLKDDILCDGTSSYITISDHVSGSMILPSLANGELSIMVNGVLSTDVIGKSKALQDGTPKWQTAGEQRACYALLSDSKITYLDKYFHPIKSSEAKCYKSETHGEFGSSMLDVFSNLTWAPSDRIKYQTNNAFVDSDHTDQTISYVLSNGTFRAINRISGNHNFDYPDTKGQSIQNCDLAMTGSASYNYSRKELVILSNVSNMGKFMLITFKGLDLDKYPSPELAFKSATRNDISLSFAEFWPNNDSECLHNIKPVLCDDGSIFVSVMFPRDSLCIFKIIQSDIGAEVSIIGSKNIMSVGRDDGAQFGQKRIQSRDKSRILSSCVYFHSDGLISWIIDKRESKILNSNKIDCTNLESYPVPYGDREFSSYVFNKVKMLSGKVINLESDEPIAFTQVVDYSLLDNQMIA